MFNVADEILFWEIYGNVSSKILNKELFLVEAFSSEFFRRDVFDKFFKISFEADAQAELRKKNPFNENIRKCVRGFKARAIQTYFSFNFMEIPGESIQIVTEVGEARNNFHAN